MMEQDLDAWIGGGILLVIIIFVLIGIFTVSRFIIGLV